MVRHSCDGIEVGDRYTRNRPQIETADPGLSLNKAPGPVGRG